MCLGPHLGKYPLGQNKILQLWNVYADKTLSLLLPPPSFLFLSWPSSLTHCTLHHHHYPSPLSCHFSLCLSPILVSPQLPLSVLYVLSFVTSFPISFFFFSLQGNSLTHTHAHYHPPPSTHREHTPHPHPRPCGREAFKFLPQ